MTVDDKIIDEKLQYNINREAAKISALSSGKTDKYEYLTGEEILPSNQIQIKGQVKFPYSLLGKAFEKNPEKHVGTITPLDLVPTLQGIFSQNLISDLIRVKLKKTVNLQDIFKTDNLRYKSKSRKVYNFNEYSLPFVFFKDIHEGHLSLKNANDEQQNFVG